VDADFDQQDAMLALDAMLIFLEHHLSFGDSDDIRELVLGLRYHVQDGEPVTIVPGMWEDWKSAFDEARRRNESSEQSANSL
jgi:hypothetical protein